MFKQSTRSSSFNSGAAIGSGIAPTIAGRFPNPAFFSSLAFGVTTTDTQTSPSIGGIGTFAEFEQAITVDNVPVAEAIGRFAEELALHDRLGALASGFLPRSDKFLIHTFVSLQGSAKGFGNGKLGVVNAFLREKASEPNAAEFFGFSNQLQPNVGFNGTHLSGIAISRKVPEPAIGQARILQQVNEDLSQLRDARLNDPHFIPEREAELRIDLISIEFTIGVKEANRRAVRRAEREVQEHINEYFGFFVRSEINRPREMTGTSIADAMVTRLLNTEVRRQEVLPFLEQFQLQRRLQEDGPLEIDQVIDRLRELVPEMDE